MAGSNERTERRLRSPNAPLARLGRRIPLFVKLIVPLLALATTAVLSVGMFLGRQIRSGLMDAYREEAIGIAELVRANLSTGGEDRGEVEDLLATISTSVKKVAALHVYRLEPDGELRVWASTSPEEVGRVETGADDRLETTLPLIVEGRAGAVSVYTFLDGLEGAVAERTRELYVVLGSAGVVSVLLGFLLLYLQVLRRTARLSRAVRRVAEGDLGVRLVEEGAPGGRDVLFNVAREFDHMLDAVETRTRQQEAVARIGQRALDGVDTQTLMDEAIGLLATHLNVEHSAVLEQLPDGNDFLVRAGVGWRTGMVGDLMIPTGRESQAGYTVVIPGRDRPFGVLAAHSDRPWSPTENDMIFYRAMANTLGSALEHRRGQWLLRETEEKYRSLVEHVPAITYIAGFGASGRWEFVSPQIESMLGFAQEEFIEDPHLWFERVHPQDRERVMVEEEQSRASGEVFESEYRIHAKDGRVVWLHDRALAIEMDGRPRLQGVMYDVTERREAEERGREALARYQTLVEQVPAVVYVDAVDDLRTPVYVSPRLVDLIGYTAEEHMASPTLWIELLHPEDRDAVLAESYRTNETGEPFRLEYRLMHRDGRVVWVRDEATLITGADGEPGYWQGILYDITELKLAEESLRRGYEREREVVERLRTLDEMKNAFLAAVSHELRTPLSAVLGYALTLDRGDIPLTAEERGELTHRLAVNARKLERLLSDLLDLDRLARGVLQPRLHAADLRQLCERVIAEADVGGHEILLDVPSLIVEVDAPKVERILENLVANAAKHTPPGTRIWVAFGRKDDGLLLVVEDEGPGVPDELKEAIFEPFRQGAGEEARVAGTGIGLSLVARFAELHGGRAWVEDRPDGGSSFRVLLPVPAGDANMTLPAVDPQHA